MSISSILKHGESLLRLLERRSRPRIPLEKLPDSQSLAGVPLRILLSDHSGPGAVLRDAHMIRPSAAD
jgi:hypothetical protein